MILLHAATPPKTNAFAAYRSIVSIVTTLTVLQAAVGALSVIGPLSLATAGATTVSIGLVASSYALGFFLGSRIAPKEVGRIGHIRSIATFGAIASLAAASLYFSTAISWWVLVQFVIGGCVAALFAAGEAWVADAAPVERRGVVLGFYLVISKLGFVAGPFLASRIQPGDTGAFLLIAMLFTASIVPVAATRRHQPSPPSAEPYGPIEIWRTTPSAVIAAFVAGLVNGSVVQLYAIFADTLTSSATGNTVAVFGAAMIGGSIVAQWPAGALSDRLERRTVIAGLAIVGGVASIAITLLVDRSPVIAVYVLAGVWGAGAMSFYGVAVAHAADRAAPGQSTSMMSGILSVWAVGSMIGPLVAGTAMNSALGPSALFYFASVCLFGLAAGMTYRRLETEPVAEDDKGSFAPAATTSVSAIELTSMSENDRAESDPLDKVIQETQA